MLLCDEICIIPLFRRKALEMWKQKHGSAATYNNLIKVFEQAGFKGYAEFVKGLLMKNVQADTGDSNRNITPPPPSKKQPSPVFPSESEQFSESPSYAAAAEVKLLQEDYQLGTKEAVNIIFEEHNNNAILVYLHYLDGTSIKLNTVKIVPAFICILQLNQCFIHNYSERNPGSNPRIRVKKSPCDDDRSSQSQFSENDGDSDMEVEHQGIVVSC